MKNNRRVVESRQQEVLRIVNERGVVSVEEIAEKLSVSQMTIRRDLAYLSDKGLLVRKHGSAESVSSEYSGSRDFSAALVYRDAISIFAATLVEDGDKIFINGSRTALNLLNYTGEKKVRIVTNNGWAVDGNYPETVHIRMTGGDLYEHILVGQYAVETLIGLSADKLFVGCAAVYADGQFRYDIPSEIGINEMMVSRTEGDIYVLADHTKLHVKEEQEMPYGCFRYPVPVTLITDEKADPEILKKIRSNAIRILQVSLDGKLIEDTSL
ncbi:MAG: DeoR/GlpR transcriptional regulator [Anaerolineaceae bacterium]|nr:DeoR/GlpR transcriptional regulator [Anaerolineaceae bacterium]